MRNWTLLLVFFGLLLAACNPAPSQQAIPASEGTAEASATPERSATPLRRPTLPPTWTPTPEATIDVTQEEESTPDVLATRQAEQYSGTSAAADGGVCVEFEPDTEQSDASVEAGESANVYWTEADGPVFYYEVVLTDSLGNSLDTERTTPQSTHATLSGRVFEAGQFYYWTVTAYDASAESLCKSRTVEIRVQS